MCLFFCDWVQHCNSEKCFRTLPGIKMREKNEMPGTFLLTVIPSLSYKLRQQYPFWKKLHVQVIIKDTPVSNVLVSRTENNFGISFLIRQKHLSIRKLMAAGTDSPYVLKRDWLTCWVTLSSLNIFILYSSEIFPNIAAYKQLGTCYLPLQPDKSPQYLCMSRFPSILRVWLIVSTFFARKLFQSIIFHVFEAYRSSKLLSIATGRLYNIPLHIMYLKEF